MGALTMFMSGTNGRTLVFILGLLYCAFIITFFTLSIPVYIYRVLVKFVAKIFRPDLGEILNGQSSLFAVDYFLKTPPRSNIIFTLTFKGTFSKEKAESRVAEKWIQPRDPLTGKILYEQFQQHPVRWLGFTFWKHAADTFLMENHVFLLSGSDTPVTKERLRDGQETLLNSHLPRNKSPWEVHVIENYEHPENPREKHSVIIFKFHHCFSDGLGLLHVLADEFLGVSTDNGEMKKAVKPRKSASPWKTLLGALSFLYKMSYQVPYALSYNFLPSPYKVPDDKKEWYQVLAETSPIPVSQLKDIKNVAGVSFTSVLMSALSAAIDKSLTQTGYQRPKTMFCISILPARGIGKRKVLANHMSGALLDLPVTFDQTGNCVTRLYAANQVLKEAMVSTIPVAAQLTSTLLGAHLFEITKLFCRNKMIPTSISNTATLPVPVILNEGAITLTNVQAVTGCFQGDIGVLVLALSYNGNIQIQVCAERSIMSRDEVDNFANFFAEEITSLHCMMMKYKMWK